MDSTSYGIPTAMLRAGSVASVLAGLMMALGFVLHPTGEDASFGTDPLWVPAHGLLWMAFTLALLGWVAVYIGHASRAGRVGLAGFILITLGTSLTTWIFSSDVTYVPVIAARSPILLQEIMTNGHILVGILSVMMWVLGSVIFGLSTIVAKVYPRWAAALMVVGATIVPVAYVTGLPEKVVAVGGIIEGAAQVWLGYSLLQLVDGRIRE